MGIFERIRQASPWVLSTFAIVFVGFMVLGDMDFSSMQSSGNNPNSRVIATVNEQPVSYIEYENNVKNQLANQKQQNAQQNSPQEIDDNAVRRSVFTNMVDMTLMKEKAQNMGIVSTDKVVAEYMANFPPQSFVQRFSDSTGFRRDVYLRYITNPEGFATDMMSRNPNSQPGQVQQLTQDIREELRLYADYVKEQLYQSALQTAIVEAGSIVSEEKLKQDYINQNSYADFEMVYLKASSINDSEIEITDAGLNEFYNKYKEQYKQAAQRKVKYASFKVAPSQQDSSNAQRKLQKIAKLLNKAKNKQEREKLFKEASYEYGGTQSDLVSFAKLDRFAQQYLKNARPGDIIGPARTNTGNSYYRVARIDSGEVTEVKASHILVNFNDDKDSALKAANLIYQRAARGEDFGALATDLSQDQGSARNGGELGYFGKGQMVAEFEKAAFDAEVGVVTKPVESQFGYHIIKVSDKVDARYQIETIEVKPTTGSNTRKQIQLKARDFAERIKAGEDFDAVAEELGASTGETAPFFEMQAILGSGYVNTFAFNNEVGAVSKPLDLPNFGVTVVKVSEAIPAGTPSLESIKNELTFVYKNKLKKDALKDKIDKIHEAITKSGDMQNAKAIDPTIQIRNITNNKNTGLISGVQGKEDVVTSVVFNQELGSISKPIRGNTGYFIVKTNSKNIASPTLVEKNFGEFAEKAITTEKRGGFYQWYQELKKDANIEDKRSEIYTKY